MDAVRPDDSLLAEEWRNALVHEGPSWLDRAKLPFDPAMVREIHSPGYRDRYVAISGEELKDWHETAFPVKWRTNPMPYDAKQQYDAFADHPGRSGEGDVYILHWEEWESGMN